MSTQERWQAFPSVGHRVGLGLIASAGLVSALSTFAFLSYIGWNAYSAGDKSKPFSRGLRTFTLSSLGWYLISLVVSDFLQGVAFALNFHWAAKGMMDDGIICMIQGVVSQIGDLGAAIWSTAIAFHTFWLLFLIKQPHRWSVLGVLVAGWSMLIVAPILGPTVIQTPTRGSFYGLSGAWCWIGTGYSAERLIFLYGWVFAALGSSFIIYTLISLRFSGFITYDDAGKVRFHFRRPPPLYLSAPQVSSPTRQRPAYEKPRETGRLHRANLVTGESRPASTYLGSIRESIVYESSLVPATNAQLKRVARRIMWYPVLYAVVVIPVSVCRMGVLAGWEPPFGLLVFAGICFGSSGLSNTILFLTTRKNFITQGNNAPASGIRITTQQVTMHDNSTSNDGEIELKPIKSPGSQLASPLTANTPVILYSGHAPKGFQSGGEESVLFIDRGGDKYKSSGG
ncbi:hypothetical protein JB92DRAFT_2997708 [Gautieria morchelliformis]|nr:hypothetical protein JB92DRAFT_2997708 [Gautieria morchelliformis]